jgi:uncharacterized protein with beta-barrel porin domain
MSLNSTTNYTDLALNSDTTLTGTGTLTLSDSPNNRIYGTGTLTNDTSHTIQGAGQIGLGQIGLVNKGTIIANAASPLNIQTGSLFNNQGTLSVLPGSTMNIIGGYTQTAGLTSVNGSLNASTIGISGGILSGSGTVFGNVSISGTGTAHPGNSPGVLTVSGNYTSTGGTLAIDIHDLATGAGKGFSQLQVTGTAALGVGVSTLQINVLPGAVVYKNDEFKILDAIGGLSGTFASLTGAYASDFTPLYTSNDVILEATQSFTAPVPLPPSLLLLAPGLAGLVGRRWLATRKKQGLPAPGVAD